MTSGGKRTGSIDWKATETRELLAKLVADGLAYSAIGAEMSAALGVKVTRSAIAGAMLRYGRDFARPAASVHSEAKAKRKQKPRKRGFTFAPATKAERALVAKPPKEAPLPKPVTESQPVDLFDAPSNRCRYPLWGNEHHPARHLVCGAAVAGPGEPYCAGHALVCYAV